MKKILLLLASSCCFLVMCAQSKTIKVEKKKPVVSKPDTLSASPSRRLIFHWFYAQSGFVLGDKNGMATQAGVTFSVYRHLTLGFGLSSVTHGYDASAYDWTNQKPALFIYQSKVNAYPCNYLSLIKPRSVTPYAILLDLLLRILFIFKIPRNVFRQRISIPGIVPGFSI